MGNIKEFDAKLRELTPEEKALAAEQAEKRWNEMQGGEQKVRKTLLDRNRDFEEQNRTINPFENYAKMSPLTRIEVATKIIETETRKIREMNLFKDL